VPHVVADDTGREGVELGSVLGGFLPSFLIALGHRLAQCPRPLSAPPSLATDEQGSRGLVLGAALEEGEGRAAQGEVSLAIRTAAPLAADQLQGPVLLIYRGRRTLPAESDGFWLQRR